MPSGRTGLEPVSPVSAQPRPDRDAIRSEVDAYRLKAAQAARIFLDASKSDDERNRAVADVTTFVDKQDVDGALAVFRNERESGRIRALALGLVPIAAVDQDALLTDVLAVVKNPRAPAELRQKALDLVPVMLFSSMAAHARHGEVLTALRGLRYGDGAHGSGARRQRVLELPSLRSIVYPLGNCP